MKRYFANDRLAWGKFHINGGDELVDPPPSEQQALVDLLVKAGAVRVVDEPDVKPKAKTTYKTRALEAEKPQPPKEPPEAPAHRFGRTVGAMTTENEPSLSNKADE